MESAKYISKKPAEELLEHIKKDHGRHQTNKLWHDGVRRLEQSEKEGLIEIAQTHTELHEAEETDHTHDK